MTQKKKKIRAFQRAIYASLGSSCCSLCLLLSLMSCPPPYAIIYTPATLSYLQIPNSLMYLLFCQLGMILPLPTPALIPVYSSELTLGITSCKKCFPPLKQFHDTLLCLYGKNRCK